MLASVSEQRSRNMAAIRSKDTKPELFVRKAVHSAGFRYRLHNKDLPGKPDLVFPKYRLVAFVHGCYWHGHICKEAKRPHTNLTYWGPKIEGNMARDVRNNALLREQGWGVVIIRECTVKQDTVTLLDTLNTMKGSFETL